MQNSEFEKSVQQKMNELKIPPPADLWEKIEPKLPAPGKDRRWLVFFLLFAVLTGATLLTWNKYSPSQKQTIADAARRRQAEGANLTAAENGKTVKAKTPDDPKTTPKLAESLSTTEKTVDGKDNDVTGTRATNQDKKQGLAVPGATGPSLTGTRTRHLNQSGTFPESKINISAPSAETTAEPIPADLLTGKTSDPAINNSVVPDSIAGPAAVANVPSPTLLPGDSGNILLHTENAASNPPSKKSRTVSNPWVYGLHLGAGISNVTNGLFSDSKVFADAQGNLSTGSPGPGTPAAPASPANPRSGGSFEIGFYFKKELNPLWSMSTAVNYTYQSNTLKTGSRVDSTIQARFSSDNFTANNFYRTGNSAIYRNKFHMLSVPLFVEYRFHRNIPISVEFGPAINYLLQSNSLVYNSTLRAYVTDDNVFNKLLVSLNVGTSLDMQKITKLPLRLGYRFQYSPGSVTKKSFGKQHLLNSTFYLDIPLKK